MPGQTGNAKGRPRKPPPLDMGNPYHFAMQPIEIVINGEKQVMTRQEVVSLKIFESAVKGKVTSLRYLDKKFSEEILTRQSLEFDVGKWLDRLVRNPEGVSPEAMTLVRMAQEALARDRAAVEQSREEFERKNKRSRRQ